jgi:predicted pyridoxine 5'-phosphate oxidase superfamily flavin-nucleotide-binding protein
LFDTALADGFACLVGTATKDGQPQISPKGSVMVFDDETLAYWERAKRSGLANLEENPKVVVYYSHPVKRIRWRFYGEASIHDSGAIREEVMSRTVQAELDRDPERLGVAVLIRVDQVGELSGNILQQRD